MITKTVKFIICSLCILLSFSSCTLFNEVKQEAERVAVFTEEFITLVEEPTVEKAQELVHPKSNLTAESVIEKIQNNEKLADLDLTQEVTIGEVSDLKLLHQDAELGGNVYSVDCQVIVGGVAIDVSLILLSTEEGLGLYDFDIK